MQDVEGALGWESGLCATSVVASPVTEALGEVPSRVFSSLAAPNTTRTDINFYLALSLHEAEIAEYKTVVVSPGDHQSRLETGVKCTPRASPCSFSKLPSDSEAQSGAGTLALNDEDGERAARILSL